MRWVAAGLIAVAALSTPGTAAAHLRSARVAVDYRATIGALRGPLAGAVTGRVYRTDLALGLTALGAHRVVVLGYLGEPFLRLGPGGAFVNEASTTAAGSCATARHTGCGARRTRPRSGTTRECAAQLEEAGRSHFWSTRGGPG